jgi:hypothetical protein
LGLPLLVKTPLLRQLLFVHEQELLFLHRVGLRTGSSGHVRSETQSEPRIAVFSIVCGKPASPRTSSTWLALSGRASFVTAAGGGVATSWSAWKGHGK